MSRHRSWVLMITRWILAAALAVLGTGLLGAGPTRAATYLTWIAQAPTTPSSQDTVTVWVNSDTAFGETVALEYQIDGVYTNVDCAYNTSYAGADWQCTIPAQGAGASVQYQLFVYNQSGQPYDYSGFNWSYTVGALRSPDNVEWDGLYSDQSPLYFSPQEPQPGASLTITLRSLHNDLTAANLQWYDTADPATGWNHGIPMSVVGQDATGTYDLWQTTWTIPTTPGNKFYRFQLIDGSASTYYDADGPTCGSGGQSSCQAPTTESFWVIPGFQTPTWSKQAIYYQIFPDRFRNGDPSNDLPYSVDTSTTSVPISPSANGECPAGSYVYGNYCAYTHASWNDLPENPPNGEDFFGGDLKGITEEIDPYLKQTLGVNALYLNPIFTSPSNHKYDTQDYFSVDPHFGDNGALQQLLTTAHSTADFAGDQRMSVMLDGVFNHTGTASAWFQSATQSQQSPDSDRYYFLDWPDTYCDWSGVTGMPKLNYASQSLRNDIWLSPNSVMQTYLNPPYSIDGWRYDVADNLVSITSAPSAGSCGGTDDHQIWQSVRSTLKPAFPEALMLGEYWQKPTDWLQGDQWDSVMNYNGFNIPVSEWITGVNVHGEVGDYGNCPNYSNNVCALTPSQLDAWLHGTLADNNRSSQLSMMNSLTTHDTARFLWRAACGTNFGSGAECGSTDSSQNDAVAKLELGIIMQMTYVGSPSIYYGDEIGMTGGNDPDNRRPFDWNESQWNLGVLNLYRTLIALRTHLSALRDGTFQTLLTDDANDVYAYGRADATSQAAIALNDGANAANETLDLASLGITDGTTVVDVLSGATYMVRNGAVTLTLPAHGGVVLVPQSQAPANPAPFAPSQPTTQPATSAALARTPNATGWVSGPQTVTLRANQGGDAVAVTYDAVNDAACSPSAVASCSVYTAPLSFSADGTYTVTYFSAGVDGAMETPHTLAVKIDSVPPTTAIAVPSATTYTLNQAVSASYTCADSGSGVATCQGPVASGSAIDTASVGSKTFTVQVTDMAGNSSAQSVAYTVAYGVSLLFDANKPVHAGATLRIKLQLVDATGVNVSAPGIVVTALTVDGGPVHSPGNSQPGNRFTYRPRRRIYRFNLKTTGLARGPHTLTYAVSGDPTVHTVVFQVR